MVEKQNSWETTMEILPDYSDDYYGRLVNPYGKQLKKVCIETLLGKGTLNENYLFNMC